MKWILLLFVLLGSILPAACKSLPGADGRYADFDQGRSNNRADLAGPETTPTL